ncbi:family A G protein-coupled receptor-like protein [Stereum hirsutum FP-91666 SS1]|uniref:family A G protein-coupled receptor-like protein n=1 Tax=Stereum hirsutum (strain FP-91666) TaxID=721885 RepID=UPI000440C51F|nr:family A G protein-coupled receptor-like protein [Stereum hirsutum FP-91666 SS1]EIM87465.1 family A G protein-coupled receptor-like protein [Stereum hirsutum FP-91666 SS1]
MLFEVRANHALDSNPPDADLHITTHGSDWLWAVFSVMLLADLLVLFSSLRRPKAFILHQLAIIILTTSSIAYFSMASDLGHTPITVEFNRSHEGPLTRDIWYVRYIQWFINAPLLLLSVFLGTGFPLGATVSTFFLADAAVVVGLVGALVHSTYKWGYYVFAVFSLFYVFAHLIFHTGRNEFPSPTGRTHGAFLGTALLLSFIWTIYLIIWPFTDGGNVISPTGEVVWYGIVDLLAGPVFLAFFLWTHRDVELGYAAENGAVVNRDVKA